MSSWQGIMTHVPFPGGGRISHPARRGRLYRLANRVGNGDEISGIVRKEHLNTVIEDEETPIYLNV